MTHEKGVQVKKCKSGANMAVTSPGVRLQFVSNSRFAGANKSFRCDLVEVNKIGIDHLAGAGKMVAMS